VKSFASSLNVLCVQGRFAEQFAMAGFTRGAARFSWFDASVEEFPFLAPQSTWAFAPTLSQEQEEEEDCSSDFNATTDRIWLDTSYPSRNLKALLVEKFPLLAQPDEMEEPIKERRNRILQLYRFHAM